MIKVKMLKDERGSQHGSVVEDFKKGKVYDVTEDLATAFLSTDSIELLNESKNSEHDIGDIEEPELPELPELLEPEKHARSVRNRRRR